MQPYLKLVYFNLYSAGGSTDSAAIDSRRRPRGDLDLHPVLISVNEPYAQVL